MKTWMWGRWVVLFVLISQSLFAQIHVYVDNIYVSPGDTIEIPINVEDVTDSSIESFQFDFFFNDTVLSPIGATLRNTIAESWGSPFINMNNSGEMRVGAYGLDYLQGAGPIIMLKFLAIGAIGDSSQLEIQNFIFNNGKPEVTIQNGQLIVEKIVQLTVQANLAGVHIQMDGKDYSLPFSVNLIAFSSHSVAIDSVLDESKGVRYIFDRRSDGFPINHAITLDSANMTLNIFYKKQYYLKIESQYDHPVGEGWYDKDSLAVFSVSKYDTVASSIRYRFMYWSGDIFQAGPSGSVTMDTSKLIMANFIEEIFVSIGYNKADAGHTVPAAPGTWVEKGEEITLTAYPESEYYFLSWGGDTSITDNPISFTVTAPVNIIANFGNIFPVELSAWVARAGKDNSAHLFWETRSEINNLGFYIQRKDSLSSFTEIAFIKGHGTSARTHDFSYIDKNLNAGRYFYRLKQVDFNGKSYFSEIKSVTISNPKKVDKISNYPNPFNLSTTIQFSLSKTESIEFRIFNLIGEEVYHSKRMVLEKGTHHFIWEGRSSFGSELPSGVYILEFNTPNRIMHHKLILSK